MSAQGFMRVEIDAVGLKEFGARVGATPSVINSEAKTYARTAGLLVKGEARKLAVGNILPNSVQMRPLAGGTTVIIGSVAKTALSIERGREKGDQPRADLITRWMNRRGIAAQVEGARVSLKTRRVLGVSTKSEKGRAIGRAQRDLAWKIAMAIKEHGTKALPFIIPAYKHKHAEIEALGQRMLQRVVHRTVGR